MKRLICVKVIGYDDEGNEIGKMDTRIMIEGNWLTPKNAKKQLKRMGATQFHRFNIWE